MRASLSALLTELCGSPTRARFWFVYLASSTVLVTLFGVLLMLPPESAWQQPAWREMLVGVRMGVFGLLWCLGATAFVLMVSIAKHERSTMRRRDPSWMKMTPSAPER